MSKYLLILFLFFMPFFFFSFHAFLFFFFWGCAVLLFSVLDIFLFLSGGCRNCSSCFWSLFLVSYFLGPCVFSLSPSIAWTSRSEIDSSLFLAASLIVFVEPCNPIENHIMNDMPKFWHQICLCTIFAMNAMCEMDM